LTTGGSRRSAKGGSKVEDSPDGGSKVAEERGRDTIKARLNHKGTKDPK